MGDLAVLLVLGAAVLVFWLSMLALHGENDIYHRDNTGNANKNHLYVADATKRNGNSGLDLEPEPTERNQP